MKILIATLIACSLSLNVMADEYPRPELDSAKLAQEILAGGAKSAVQPRIAPRGEYLFSHAALARWGIQLPDDIARRTEWRP